MSNIKDQLIRLGSTNPELQKDIRPVLAALDKQAAGDSLDGAIQEWAEKKLAPAFKKELESAFGKGDFDSQWVGKQGTLVLTYENDRFEGIIVKVSLGYTKDGMRSFKLQIIGDNDEVDNALLLQGEYPSDESPKGLASLIHQANRNW